MSGECKVLCRGLDNFNRNIKSGLLKGVNGQADFFEGVRDTNFFPLCQISGFEFIKLRRDFIFCIGFHLAISLRGGLKHVLAQFASAFKGFRNIAFENNLVAGGKADNFFLELDQGIGILIEVIDIGADDGFYRAIR